VRKSVAVLASGGIDSTAVVSFYERLGYSVKCIHFQYGQPSAQSEKSAVTAVAKHFHVPLRTIDLGFEMKKSRDEFLGRNAIFVLSAAALEPTPAHIALGIHSGSPYYDSSQGFIQDCQRVLDGFFAGTVRVEAPFMEYTKKDILSYCRRHRLPLNLTYSCVRKNGPPCGVCPSCMNRVGIERVRARHQ